MARQAKSLLGSPRDIGEAPPAGSIRRGRPRDTAIDARILKSAAILFGRFGWGDFSIEKTAKHAGVSKATLYLRWVDKEALLLDALASTLPSWRLDSRIPPDRALVVLVETMTRDFSIGTGWAFHRALMDSALPVSIRDYCRQLAHDRRALIDHLIGNVREGAQTIPRRDLQLLRNCLIGATLGEGADIMMNGHDPDPTAAQELAEAIVRLITIVPLPGRRTEQQRDA